MIMRHGPRDTGLRVLAGSSTSAHTLSPPAPTPRPAPPPATRAGGPVTTLPATRTTRTIAAATADAGGCSLHPSTGLPLWIGAAICRRGEGRADRLQASRGDNPRDTSPRPSLFSRAGPCSPPAAPCRPVPGVLVSTCPLTRRVGLYLLDFRVLPVRNTPTPAATATRHRRFLPRAVFPRVVFCKAPGYLTRLLDAARC